MVSPNNSGERLKIEGHWFHVADFFLKICEIIIGSSISVLLVGNPGKRAFNWALKPK